MHSVDSDQTPHSAASDLGQTACLCPINGTLGLNGLTCLNTKIFHNFYIIGLNVSVCLALDKRESK